MKPLLFIIIMVLYSCITSTKNDTSKETEYDYIKYHLIANQGILEMFRKNYSTALNHFKESEKYAPTYYDENRNDHFNKAKCYAQLNNFDSTLEELEKSLKKGFPFKKLQKDTLLSSFQNSVQWEGLIENREILEGSFYKNIDTVLRRKVLNMVERDHKYRLIFPQTDSIRTLLSKADSINRIELKNIFNQYGFFPSFKEIGTNDLMLIFIHTPFSFRTPYLPLLEKHLQKGNITPAIYTGIFDNTYLQYPVDTTIYGVYVQRNFETKKMELKYSLEEYPRLDSMRTSVGYFTMKEQQEYIDLIFNLNK